MTPIGNYGSITGSLINTILKGKSAYEIAVQHGFIGTEEEWLNSLAGDDIHIEMNSTETWSRMIDYIPEAKTIIVYSDYKTDKDGNYIPGLKIADGNAYVVDLPFITTSVDEEHIEEQVTETVMQEVTNGITVDIPEEATDGILILYSN